MIVLNENGSHHIAFTSDENSDVAILAATSYGLSSVRAALKRLRESFRNRSRGWFVGRGDAYPNTNQIFYVHKGYFNPGTLTISDTLTTQSLNYLTKDMTLMFDSDGKRTTEASKAVVTIFIPAQIPVQEDKSTVPQVVSGLGMILFYDEAEEKYKMHVASSPANISNLAGTDIFFSYQEDFYWYEETFPSNLQESIVDPAIDSVKKELSKRFVSR